jgi:hypothetical protein
MRQLMIVIVSVFAMALAVSACSKDDSAGPSDECARTVFPSYNPKVFDQCVAVCKQCEKGVTVTCSTACRLRGAQ